MLQFGAKRLYNELDPSPWLLIPLQRLADYFCIDGLQTDLERWEGRHYFYRLRNEVGKCVKLVVQHQKKIRQLRIDNNRKAMMAYLKRRAMLRSRARSSTARTRLSSNSQVVRCCRCRSVLTPPSTYSGHRPHCRSCRN